MKKNAFAALVILLVTVAFLFVVNDLSKSNNSIQVNTHKIHQKSDLVGLDRE